LATDIITDGLCITRHQSADEEIKTVIYCEYKVKKQHESQ